MIAQHLAQTFPEPEKIYFPMAKQSAAPLSVQQFQFKKRGAIAINANSYPAICLKITYKFFIQCLKFAPNIFTDQNNPLFKIIQCQITKDIQAFLNNSDIHQILVYIQDKQRLEKIIETIRQERGEFNPYREFPFLILRSYSLEEMRVNMLTDKYLLNSHELNVLNLILANEGKCDLEYNYPCLRN